MDLVERGGRRRTVRVEGVRNCDLDILKTKNKNREKKAIKNQKKIIREKIYSISLTTNVCVYIDIFEMYSKGKEPWLVAHTGPKEEIS